MLDVLIQTHNEELNLPHTLQSVKGWVNRVFVVDSGVVTVRSAKKVTLDELLAGFDPEKHRYTAEERFWDDPPVGTEIW